MPKVTDPNLRDEQAMLRDGKAHVRRLSKQATREA
jgi:hypothetical protein